MQPAISSALPGLPSGDTRVTKSSGVSCSVDLTIPAVISDGYTASQSAQSSSIQGKLLTSRRDNVESNLIPRQRSCKLFRHMRHAGLTSRVREMRQRHTTECPDRTGDDGLATLDHIALFVSGVQERQEGCDAEVDGAHVVAEGAVEFRGIGGPEVFLEIGERGAGGAVDGRWTGDAGVGDQ